MLEEQRKQIDDMMKKGVVKNGWECCTSGSAPVNSLQLPASKVRESRKSGFAIRQFPGCHI
jgi:hypothetical protein